MVVLWFTTEDRKSSNSVLLSLEDRITGFSVEKGKQNGFR